MNERVSRLIWSRVGGMCLVLLVASCAGPLVQSGELHLGRTVSLTPTMEVESIGDAIPVKNARLYRAVLYVVTEGCYGRGNLGSAREIGESTPCQVRVADLGVLPLAAPDTYYKIRYRGVMFWPAVLSIELNDNSTLRSIRITEDFNGHDLYIGLGPLGPGIR